MTIDFLYKEIDRNNFYVGRVSQVYRDNCVVQVENLSLLMHRKIIEESLSPSTINYFVIIDSIEGIFLGEVYQNRVSLRDSLHDSINHGTVELITPEMSIDIIGLIPNTGKKFKFPEFLTVGVADKVYLANKDVMQLYISSIEVSKEPEITLPSLGTYLNRVSADVELKPSTLFSHHLLIVGATNSGKSTSALAILDKIILAKKKALIIDPTGEYKAAFSSQEAKKISLGIDTTISPGKITMQQWAMLFETNSNTQGAVLAEAIRSLRYQKKHNQTTCLTKTGKNIAILQQQLATVTSNDTDFDITLLPSQIAAESVSESKNGNDYAYDSFKAKTNDYLVQKVLYQLANTNFSTFFSNDSTKHNLLDEVDIFLHTPETSLYIDSSALGVTDGIGGMIIDLICYHIMSRDSTMPFVFFVDEVHRYTKSLYSEAEYHGGLTLISREGRKKGVFLFLTTQNPQDVSPVLLGQVGTLLVHRLMHNDEIRVIQNHLDEYTIKYVRKLNQGEAILSSVNLIHNIYIRVNKCNRTQYNVTPLL